MGERRLKCNKEKLVEEEMVYSLEMPEDGDYVMYAKWTSNPSGMLMACNITDENGKEVNTFGGHWMDMASGVMTLEEGNYTLVLTLFTDAEHWKVYWGGFDVLGHIDFPKRYYGEIYYVEAEIREIFERLLEKNRIIEINTSSLRKRHSETMPGKELLEIYRDCDGRYITVGSDAHEEQDVGADCETTQELAKEIGLVQVVYRQRKRVVIP